MSFIGTSAFGLRMPIIKEGDDVVDIITSSLGEAYDKGEYQPKENDIIGITESVVARAEGRYVTLDDIVKDLKEYFPDNSRIYVYNPIYSRNRFSVILRGIARYFDKVFIISDYEDEVGNVVIHPITKVNYKDFYKEICESENAEMTWCHTFDRIGKDTPIINCTLHPELHRFDGTQKLSGYVISLKEICSDVSQYGLLGSNKVNEETLKLFPDSKNQELVERLKESIQKKFNLGNVDVMIYGDGCYKDAASGIWEFADPVVSPAYTKGLKGTPSELKLKYLADDEFSSLKGEKLDNAIKERISKKQVVQGNMETQGTTPRHYTDLLGSLMDLISGSGDKGTPVVVVQDYFKNYSME